MSPDAYAYLYLVVVAICGVVIICAATKDELTDT